MAPRLTRKGQATHDRIVAVAAELMFRGGVAATSLDEVKTAAGVSSSQLYHYFADKAALVRAVIGYLTEATLGAQQPQLARLDSLEALRAWRDKVVELKRRQQCRGGCPIASLAGELAEGDEDARLALAEGFARWEDAIRAGLRAMHARGELGSANPDQLALALLAALQGGLLLTQLRRDTEPLEIALDTLLGHLASLSNLSDKNETHSDNS